MRFTLEELAHFDRCLYPDSLIEDLSNLDIFSDPQLFLYKTIFREKVPLHIIQLYQDFIHNEKMLRALEIIVHSFVKKYRDDPNL